MSDPVQILIIGSGMAGLSAAVYAARDGFSVQVIGGPLEGGLLTRTSIVENFPGFPDGIGGYELVSRMRSQAERFGAVFLHTSAEKIVPGPDIFRVHLSGGTEIPAQTVILATGASPRWLGLPSEERFVGHGVSVCANCDAAFYRNQVVAVAGGGDTAMEEALALARFASEVHVIHWMRTPSASKILLDRARAMENIIFHPDSEVSALIGDTELTAVRYRDRQTGEEHYLNCTGCFIALGHIPESSLVRDLAELTPTGCVRTFDGTAQSSIPGLFAAGDCADCRYRQAVTASGSGAAAAIDAIQYLEK